MSDNEKQNKETAVATTPRKQDIIMSAQGGLQLTGLSDMYRFAEYVITSGLAPKGFKTSEEVLITLELGLELGLKPMQALQNIAPINGRAAVWGDAVPGLVKSSGLLAYYKQEEVGVKYQDNYGWKVTSLRKGNSEPIISTFLVSDAKKAGLWGKQGPWTTNPDRMILNRCRTFNFRDNFPDVLKGLSTVEEVRDIDDAEYEIMDAPKVSRTETVAAKIGATAVSEPEQTSTPEPSQETTEVKTEAEARINYGDYVTLFPKEYASLVAKYGNPLTDDTIDAYNVYLADPNNEKQRNKDHNAALIRTLNRKIKKQEGEHQTGETQAGLGL